MKSKQSAAKRSLVYGVGINDADYNVHQFVNGKTIPCPFYNRWKSMLQRCYSDKYQKGHPTYQGCSVCEEWFSFMKFKSWMEERDWVGMHLDKDLKVAGNKVYSPDACMFVPKEINSLIQEFTKEKDLPAGVSLEKKTGKYVSHCRNGSKLEYLGIFSDPEKASAAYRSRKKSVIAMIAEKYTGELRDSLIRLSTNYI